MSQESANYAGSQASRIPSPLVNLTREGHDRGSVPRQACEWSPQISMSLLQFFTEVSYPLRHVYEIPFPDPLRSEIRRFFVSLDAYIESPDPVIPYRDILYGATKLDYADTLKRIKRKSFENSWAAIHFATPDWWKDMPWYRIYDIGQIFNFSYLIFWKEPEPDDYLNGFAAVNINATALNDFKVILECLLPPRSSFEEIDRMEVLSTISSSMSYDEKTGKHVPHYKLKPKYLRFEPQIGEVERVVLNVSPANTRDSVLLNPGALNTVSLLDKQIMEIIRQMPNHIHLRDKDEVSRRLNRFYKKFELFLQRDIRKEGITKPREILKAILEVLHKVYPDIDIFKYTSFYDDFSLRVNGERLFPDRGHGLGMANTMTTLMQLAIHTMIMDRLGETFHDPQVQCLALNDDYVVGFEEQDILDEYWDIEDEVMELLSIQRAPDKSFQSEKRFVIAERYFNGTENEKISYQIRECLLPLTCYNIVHAKEYFRSVQTYVKSDVCTKYIDEVITFWGYEFFADEFLYPYITGGWRNELINGVDLSLLELDEQPYSEKIARGAKAALATPYRKRYKGGLYTPPVMTLYGFPYIPDEFKDHFDILPYEQIDDKYGRILTRSNKEFFHYWDSLKDNRMKAYKKPCPMTYDDLIKFLISNYETTIFYPIPHMIDRYENSDILDGVCHDIYLDKNPKLSYLAKYNPIKYEFKEEFSIRFTRADEFTKKQQNLYPKDIERALKSQLLQPLMTGAVDEYLYPKDENVHPEELYLNPVRIGNVASILSWGKGYPILKEEYKSPIIEYKREVFNRLFTIKQQSILSRIGFSRKLIKTIADYLNRFPQDSFEYALDLLWEIVDDEIQKREALVSDSDSDDEAEMRFFKATDRRIIVDEENRRVVDVVDILADETLFWSITSAPDAYVMNNRDDNDIIKMLADIMSIANCADRRVFDLHGSLNQLVARYGMRAKLLISQLRIRSIIDNQTESALDDEESFDYGQLWDAG